MDITQLYNLFQQYPLVTTDSRNCPEGSLFFALKGDRFDGNQFVSQALENGASFAVADNPNLPKNDRIILVEDALKALQELANYHRKQMPAKVIGITGTNGKTTTKELISNALSAQYATLFTQGNLNNHIGVPLTLLRLQSKHQFAVIEMGANHPGEIKDLCHIAEPDFGIITNVGKAHLEGFGSFEGVIRTKAELYDFIREKNGIIFGNADSVTLSRFYPALNMVLYGTKPGSFIEGKLISAQPTLHLEWKENNEKFDLKTQLAGAYNLENVLAAICIASYLGVESRKINQAIQQYIPQNNRSQILETSRNRLIVDSYNANPSSMEAALENFADYDAPRKMVILGEMKELGVYSDEEHQHLINLVNSFSFENVFLVGQNFLKFKNSEASFRIFESTIQLIEFLKNNPPKGFTILIKGSRGNKLEEIIPNL